MGKDSFYPQPKVESEAIMLISKNSSITTDLIGIVHYIFSFKNKKVTNFLKKNHIDMEMTSHRIRELNPTEIFDLAKKIVHQVR